MNRLLLLITFVASGLYISAQNYDLKTVYQQIDEAIEQSPQVVREYEQQIADTRQQYKLSSHPEEKYQLAFRLYEQYKAFMNDSALFYLNEAEQWAGRQGQTALMGNCRALKAFQCSTVGYYTEAQTLLKNIDKQ